MHDRRATVEEIQFIENETKKIKDKNGIPINNKLFGAPLNELNSILKTLNIEYSYDKYEVYCLDKANINKICSFYSVDKLEDYSKEFSKNFIAMTIANAENRHNEAIINNLSDFHRFSKEYIEDFMKLSNITLDYDAEHINIPTYKFINSEDGRGGFKMEAERLR